MNKSLLSITAIAAALTFTLSTSLYVNAFATSDPQNGFGKAVSECASSKTCPTPNGPGSMGQHVSSFSEPRQGIGNVAKQVCSSGSVSDLGNFLSGKTDSC